MLKIIDYKDLVCQFLSKKQQEVEKFKVFVRLNFVIDVYIVLKDLLDLNVKYFVDGFEEYLKDNYSNSNLSDFNLKFHIYSYHDIEDDYVSCIFQNDDSKTYLNKRFRLNSYFNHFDSGHTLKRKTPVVTFYSYKGGMGRTTTMVSYAIDLAVNQNKKVFVIDCDLEAPGYLNFFNLSKHSGLNEGSVNGLVEFLCDCKFAKTLDSVDLGDYCINVASGNSDSERALSNIYLMPAGNLNENLSQEYQFSTHNNRESYLEGLSRLDLADEQSLIEGFQILLNKVQETIDPDIILIDSRTGFNDIIGTATMYFSNLIVGFFGYNEQTVPGLLSLIDNYYKEKANFKLVIVSSILPVEGADSLVDNEKKLILEYINNRYGQEKDIPVFSELHRSKELEKLGTSEYSTEDYIDLINKRSIEDYSIIFDCINSVFPEMKVPEEQNLNISNSIGEHIDYSNDNKLKAKKTIELRNIILRNLKETLANIDSFAESTIIRDKIFFYRDCMNDFFDEEKFIIRGYKGTGKTFLYKALADNNLKSIADTIIERANKARLRKGQEEITYAPKFLDILSIEKGQNKSFDFVGLKYNDIEDSDYYFNTFWQIHTWNSILLDPEFDEIRQNSKLSDYIKDIKGNEAIKRFRDLIDSGIDSLIVIENDFDKINEYLKSHNKKLFLLYDQLDTRINPRYWDKAVSPLINYWREKWNSYTNILPKIFVRTDLYKNNLRGTNTARLADNIISLEWSIEEIFAYFFKLVFSNPISADAFWEITNRIGIKKDWIEGTKRQFEDNNNQFKYLEKSHIDIAVRIFFGNEVVVSGSRLGKPWDYFQLNLSNADLKSISVRPFINTLDNNAIELALAKLIKFGYVQEIIHSEIYASRNVRIKAAETYFNDLTMDTSLTDLISFKNYINSDKGQDFRFKTLNETEFNSLINSVYDSNKDDFKEINKPEDLKSLLYACGIMHEHITRGGKLYSFAPMYAYSWGLKSTNLDDKIWINTESKNRKDTTRTGIVELRGSEYCCNNCAVNAKGVTKLNAYKKKISYKQKDVIDNNNKESQFRYYIKYFEVIE